ncbi:MAG: NAD(P)/FAD-dependent oxidoreductase [Bacteroidota bacterium]
MLVAHKTDVAIIGSGIAGLTAGCLLAKDGFSITVLEQNWLPGGCASSYPRKNYIFESGATTLVGLDEHMPLKFLLDEIGVDIHPLELKPPMKVYLPNGEILTRYHDLEAWISEAERVFGQKGQRAFWTYCYKLSQFVWETSLQQRAFPPSNVSDLAYAIRHFRPKQVRFAPLAFLSMDRLLDRYGLRENEQFVRFVNEQLLITAQNHVEEVNALFGATALCYTNYSNYYVPGGLINLVRPLVEYIEQNGGNVQMREPVSQIEPLSGEYLITTKRAQIRANKVISAIPINNTLELFNESRIRQKLSPKLMKSEELNSAFSLGFVCKKFREFECLHHQVHVQTPLPFAGSNSIFLSLSHPADTERCGPDEVVASVSTHVHHPAQTILEDKQQIEEVIFDVLESHDLFRRDALIFHHSSTPKAWEKWTRRAWGFVGGYPQYMRIKPWQMLDARLDHKGAYICGDSTYPGQGIPGACLSGIIAYQKLKMDSF